MKEALRQTLADKLIALTILVSALGYFVDIFDLLLFSIVRVQSLKDLGVAETDLLAVGIRLLNAQRAGRLLGGIGWGGVACAGGAAAKGQGARPVLENAGRKKRSAARQPFEVLAQAGFAAPLYN